MEKAISRKPSQALTGKQRSFLRGLAHHLDPIVIVGKEGLTEPIHAATVEALGVHELIKVRVLESSPVSRDEVAEPLAKQTGSHIVGTIGRIVVLYRMHDEKPVIDLPRR
jgi:RNA-binding protein